LNAKLSGVMNEVLKYRGGQMAVRVDSAETQRDRRENSIENKKVLTVGFPSVQPSAGLEFERSEILNQRLEANMKSMTALKYEREDPGDTPFHMLKDQPQLMRAAKVAEVTGWSTRKIYELCESGLGLNEPALLEAHALPGRSVQRKQITRRSVAALLLRTATYDPEDFPTLLRLTLSAMALSQLQQFATLLQTEIHQREQGSAGTGEPHPFQKKTTNPPKV